MSNPVRVAILPLGRTLMLEQGAGLRDELFACGVEFPCGGHGRCRGCRVRVLEGDLPVTAEDARLLSRRDLDAGWRLACRAIAMRPLTLELAQWETPILADETALVFTPQEGLGVAVDLGTTTLVAQLVDLRTAQVLAVRTALNAQARHGADIMSRVDFARHGTGQSVLERLVRRQIGELVSGLLGGAAVEQSGLKRIAIVGNTVMHHLFCGLSVEPLSRHPFESAENGAQLFTPGTLGWDLPGDPTICFLPCLGSFVGSDILAGVLAIRLHQGDAPAALVDLGTNAEIIVGKRHRMLCASAAAGPAFEGGRISIGMRAADGAIAEVSRVADGLRCRVLGRGRPRGICGSGLVDAVAAGLDLGRIEPSGRLSGGSSLALTDGLVLTQSDIREVQLAKGAIAAGLRILLREWGALPDELSRLFLAGAFGNYINRTSALRIGLFGVSPGCLVPAGNTALLGAKLALFSPANGDGCWAEIPDRIQHVSLSDQDGFEDLFAAEMLFPAADKGVAMGEGNDSGGV